MRIKSTDLPDGAPLQSAFESMRTARQQEARSIRAQGAKQAQIIRAQADADASKTYAASFGKDPDFYDFYRAMQSYLTTFVGDGQDKPAPDQHHSVAAERLFEGIHWTREVNWGVQMALRA